MYNNRWKGAPTMMVWPLLLIALILLGRAGGVSPLNGRLKGLMSPARQAGACANCLAFSCIESTTKSQRAAIETTAKAHPNSNEQAIIAHRTAVTIRDHCGRWMTVADDDDRAEVGKKGCQLVSALCKCKNAWICKRPVAIRSRLCYVNDFNSPP